MIKIVIQKATGRTGNNSDQPKKVTCCPGKIHAISDLNIDVTLKRAVKSQSEDVRLQTGRKTVQRRVTLWQITRVAPVARNSRNFGCIRTTAAATNHCKALSALSIRCVILETLYWLAWHCVRSQLVIT